MYCNLKSLKLVYEKHGFVVKNAFYTSLQFREVKNGDKEYVDNHNYFR